MRVLCALMVILLLPAVAAADGTTESIELREIDGKLVRVRVVFMTSSCLPTMSIDCTPPRDAA